MKLLIIFPLIFLGFKTFAQKPDTIRAKISYAFIHVNDTNNREKPYTENMMVLVGNKASLFTSIDRVTEFQKQTKSIEEQVKNNNALREGGFTVRAPTKGGTTSEIFMFHDENKMITKHYLVNNYLIDDKIPTIDWKISSDTLTISGLKTQKATTTFKGRQYTAWFCLDLPFRSGPWKLQGLPGLIIEAYDDKKEVIFKFEELELAENSFKPAEPKMLLGEVLPPESTNAVVIELPQKRIKTTLKELMKLREVAQSDPMGFINAALSGSIANMKIAPTTTPQKQIKNSLNNPIELEP